MNGPTVRSLRTGLALLSPDMRRRWLTLVPLGVLTAALEAVSAVAVFALIRILTDPTQAATLPGLRLLARWAPTADRRTVVTTAALLLIALYVTKNLCIAATAYARSRCVEVSTAATAVALLRRYLRAPYVFHLRRNSADLVYTANQAVRTVFATAMGAALGVAIEALVVLGIATVLVMAAPRVALVTTGALLVLAAGFLRVTRHATERLGARLSVVSSGALRHLQQALGAVKELKVLGREEQVTRAYAADQDILAHLRGRRETLGALPRIVVETVFVCGALLVVLVLTLSGQGAPDTLSLLGLYAYAGFRVIPSVNRIAWLLNEIRMGAADVDRVRADLDVLAALPAPAADAGAASLPLHDRLDVEHVSYAYEGSDRAVLTDLSLTIVRGECLGIVGATGAGKSTLVDLIIGILEPTAGRVLADGTDIRGKLRAWQHGIGYVPQTIYLLDDTLRRNIALAEADHEIDEQRLRTAVRDAQLAPLIAGLADGLDTIIGERGARLSGGERQRVGIARALYHQPQLLVLDEATSALDNQTEADVITAIRGLAHVPTIILVAHRLTTVSHCDRVAFLHQDRIADVGPLAELVQRNAALCALPVPAASR